MEMNKEKTINGMGKLCLYYIVGDDCWCIEESKDTTTYDSYRDALEDFDRIVDLKTLTEVFDWHDDPFNLEIDNHGKK